MSDDSKHTKDDPLSGFSFQSLCDSFYSTQRPLFSLGSGFWNPPADVYETDEAIVIKIEVAGLDIDRLSLSMENSRLSVRGVRRDPDQPQQTRLHHVEIRYGQFERVFDLPVSIDSDKVNADYEKGFLLIHAPKRSEPPRRIDVKSD